MRQGIQLTILN